ncbi:hypothetical protein Mro03_13160 [Microbispora rosea subsp. rosea]|nr:hypothetical protein Mro03_13160 [Microbispora rosea subsp. rosea]
MAGREYEIDCVICASGFDVGTEYTRRVGYDMTDHDGVKLSEYRAEGMRTLHGTHMHGFPDAFIVQPIRGANLISESERGGIGTSSGDARAGMLRGGALSMKPEMVPRFLESRLTVGSRCELPAQALVVDLPRDSIPKFGGTMPRIVSGLDVQGPGVLPADHVGATLPAGDAVYARERFGDRGSDVLSTAATPPRRAGSGRVRAAGLGRVDRREMAPGGRHLPGDVTRWRSRLVRGARRDGHGRSLRRDLGGRG